MALSIFYFYKLVKKIIYQVLCLYNNCFRVFSVLCKLFYNELNGLELISSMGRAVVQMMAGILQLWLICCR